MSVKQKHINDLLSDERFINYILTGNRYARKYWADYRNSDPEKNEAYMEAEELIKSLQELNEVYIHDSGNEIVDKTYLRLKDSMSGNVANIKTRVRRNLILKVAAFLMLPLLLFGFLKIYRGQLNEGTANEEKHMLPDNEVKIITADGDNILPAMMDVNDTYNTSKASISKTGSTTLKYSTTGDDKQSNKKIAYNTVIVPRGKRYNIELPDGTKVWLNSDTEFEFPENFREGEPRNVKLRGEAYFEVKRDVSARFIVGTKNMDVIVYGTSFNVSAYSDEDISQTTLVEGSVGLDLHSEKNSGLYRLEPSENAVVNESSGSVEVKTVDTREYTSWKDGYIVFRDEEMNLLGPKIERWYDIQIVYRSEDIREMRFSGIISEEKSLDHILGLIEKACNLSYQKKDDKVFIYKESKIINHK